MVCLGLKDLLRCGTFSAKIKKSPKQTMIVSHPSLDLPQKSGGILEAQQPVPGSPELIKSLGSLSQLLPAQKQIQVWEAE